jgi:hypothetical protein
MALALAKPDVVEQLERAVAPFRPSHSRFGERQLDVLARRQRLHEVEPLEDEADAAQAEIGRSSVAQDGRRARRRSRAPRRSGDRSRRGG